MIIIIIIIIIIITSSSSSSSSNINNSIALDGLLAAHPLLRLPQASAGNQEQPGITLKLMIII